MKTKEELIVEIQDKIAKLEKAKSQVIDGRERTNLEVAISNLYVALSNIYATIYN